jgi:D-inositol-3-phosphate glycosyltransferase
VLYPVAGTRISGSAVSTAWLQRGLIEATDRYEPVAALPGRGATAELFESLDLRTVIAPHAIHQTSGPAEYLSKLEKLDRLRRTMSWARAVLRQVSPDIVHANDDLSALAYALVCGPGVPVIWHVRRTRPSAAPDLLRRVRSSHAILVNEGSRSRVASRPFSIPYTVLRNGVDTDRFRPRTDDEERATRGSRSPAVTIGFVGNLMPRKRPEWLLQYMEHAGTRVRAVFVGDVDEPRYREELSRTDGRVTWLGPRMDIDQLLPTFDIVVLSSRRDGEAYPRVLVEAAACGVPVVATRAGATDDIVTDGMTGYVVDPDDQVAFFNAVDTLVGDPGLRARFGRAARGRAVERFDYRDVSREVSRLYDDLDRAGGKGP